MTVRLYQSSDASAPTLTGQVGSLLTVLDAVLVNGYGSKTAAGWTIAYTGTNKRQYAPAAGGTGCQLYVDDSGPGAGGAKEARINGFKTGTGLGTGTGQFPTTSQMTATSGALVVRKSTTADATARAWTIVADGNTIYMFIETGDQTALVISYPWMFGDFFTYASGDTSNCAIIARRQENTANFMSSNYATGAPWSSQSLSVVVETFPALCPCSTTVLNDTIPGHYLCANYTGVGGSLAHGKHSDLVKMGYPSWNSGGIGAAPQMGFQGSGPAQTGGNYWNALPYPNAADGGLYTAPVWIHHGGIIRGYYKGMWNPLQHLPLGHGDTYSGSNNLAGKSFIAMNILGAVTYSSAGPTQVHIEYSDTWN